MGAVRDRYQPTYYGGEARQEATRIRLQEWLAFETIVRCALAFGGGKARPGTLAHAMFVEQPRLATTEIMSDIDARRWPRHCIRYACAIGERAPYEESSDG